MKKVIAGFAVVVALVVVAVCNALAGGSVASHATPALVSEINTALALNATNAVLTIQRGNVVIGDVTNAFQVVTNVVITIQR